MGLKEGQGQDGLSHGMCSKCYKKQFGKRGKKRDPETK